VLAGQNDIRLQTDDIVYILTNREVHDLAAKVAQLSPNGQLNNIAPAAQYNQGTQGATGNAVPGQSNGTSSGLPNGQGGQNFQPLQNTPVFPGTSIIFPNPNGQQLPNGANTQNGAIVVSSQLPSAAGNPTSYLNIPGTITPPNGLLPGTPGLANPQAAIGPNGENQPSANPTDIDVAKTLDVSQQVLTGTLNDNLVWVYDQVKDPGPYLAAQGTNLTEVVQMAGGPLRTADLTAVEVTSTTIDSATGTSRTIRTEYKGNVEDFRRVALQPFDVVRFRPVFSDRDLGRVTITGEVKYPGTFDIRRGERLSEVLARAGGLTDQAYPLGAVFTRRSAAISELQANMKEARELETALVAVAQRGSFTSSITPASATTTTPAQSGPSTTDFVNNLIYELRTAPALGRITVTADPAVLQVHPEVDIVMEGGDQLYIPKRPSTVTVTGEVLNTGSFEYRNDLRVQDYIDLAGGTRETADEGRMFIVLPDGTARPVQESWLTFNSSGSIIPPGSTIVVPLAIAPFNFWSTLGNLATLTTLTSQLAVTAVSLKVLGGH
jgi:protein involved in polysaccharide export with SLBB domain